MGFFRGDEKMNVFSGVVDTLASFSWGGVKTMVRFTR